MEALSLKNVSTFLMFMIMGCGCNWLAISAIQQETSIYIEVSPQGLCIGSFLTISNNGGFLGVLLYFIIFRRIRPIPHTVSMPVIFVMGTASVFLAAFAYKIAVDNISLYLYFSNFLAGAVGAVGSVILPQFLTRYKDHLITAGRAGGNAGILISAIVAIAQSPGGADRFSAQTYLLIFACVLITPLIPFYLIVEYRIGERDIPLLTPLQSFNENDGTVINAEGFNSSFSSADCNAVKSEAEKGAESGYQRKQDSVGILVEHIEQGVPVPASTLPHMSMSHGQVVRRSEEPAKVPWTESVSEKIIVTCFPSITPEDLEWMKRTLPYGLAVGFADFCAFGIMTSAAPFAFSKISDSGGFLNLSISIQAGACVLVFGDLLTAYYHIPLWVVVSVLFFCTMMYVLTAFGIFKISPYALIAFGVLINFMEAHTLTSTYRIIATTFPPETNQKSARLVGFLDGLLNTIGAVIGMSVVASVASC
jgi:hypothetical protein